MAGIHFCPFDRHAPRHRKSEDVISLPFLQSPLIDTSTSVQVACYGTRTTAASEELVSSCMAEGRGARFGSGLTVAQGGCIEPRSAFEVLVCQVTDVRCHQIYMLSIELSGNAC